MKNEQFLYKGTPRPKSEKEQESDLERQEEQVGASVGFLKALYYFNRYGGLNSEPPLTNQEYAQYDQDQDPTRESDIELWGKRIKYFNARKDLEEAEEELTSLGITPDRYRTFLLTSPKK